MAKPIFKITFLVCSMIAISACTTSGSVFGNSQPASNHCKNAGGYLKFDSDENDPNATGVCYLPDGQVVEQWMYYQNSINDVRSQ